MGSFNFTCGAAASYFVGKVPPILTVELTAATNFTNERFSGDF